MRHVSLVLALTACGSPSRPVPGPATPRPTTTVPVTLPPGAPELGCLGWSTANQVAACITGETASGEDPRFEVSYLGSEEVSTKLPDEAGANAMLAKLGIQAFASAARQLAPGTTDLGGGAAIVWTATETSPAGDNLPPTIKHVIVARCGSKQSEVTTTEAAGLNPELRVWTVPGYRVLDLVTQIAREGEMRRRAEPLVLELATCAVF